MSEQIVKYSITDAQIAEMGEQYSKLKIMDVHDKVGFQAVHSARMICVGKRSAIENDRKEGKKGVLEVGRAIDGEAKRLTGLVAEIEAPLEVEENRIVDEKLRIGAEAEAERERTRESERALTVERILALARYGIQISFFDAGALTVEEFDERLTTAYLDGEAAQAEIEIKNRCRATEEKINAEAAAQVARLENERLEEIRREQAEENERLEEIRVGQAEERRKIDEENRKIEAEKNRVIQAEHEAERLRMQAEREAERERLRAEREQALRPDRERLTAWVEAVTRPDPPAVTSDEALKIAAYAGRQFSDLRDRLFKAIGLMGEKP